MITCKHGAFPDSNPCQDCIYVAGLLDELAKIDELVFDGMMNAEDAEHYIECHTEDLPKLVRAMAKVMYDLKAVSQPRIDKILDEMEERYADRKDTEEGK